MGVFAWRHRPTRHFGDQWVPFAEVDLQATTRSWHLFSVQIDTGAVITVLPRSAAEILAIDVTAGEPLDLVSVGGVPNTYFVHPVSIRIGEIPPSPMRIAFAMHDGVPSLLGRLDVLDRLRIDVDAAIRGTRITSAATGPASGLP